jgi:uncharacterized protein (DUF885 family)
MLAAWAPFVQPALAGAHQDHELTLDPDRFTENTRIDQLVTQFVDAYAAWAPSTATYLGLHERDTLLEDRSRRAIDAWQIELDAFQKAIASDIERGPDSSHAIDRAALRHALRRETFDLNEIRAWERNPMYYNELLSNSVYELAAKRFAPPDERLRRIVARQRQFARLVAQAKENLVDPPEVYTRKAIELTQGTIEFLEKDLPALAAEIEDSTLVAAFREENARAVLAVRDYAAFLETDLLPRSRGEFALGRERFAKMLFDAGGFDEKPEVLLKLGERELERTLEAFQRAVRALPGKGSVAAKYDALSAAHPEPDSLVAATACLLGELRAFVVERGIVTIPGEDSCLVVPMPPFMWGFAAMNSPGPFESLATDAYYYVKTVDDSWTPEEKGEHLSVFSPWDLADASIHEAYPGHYVQGLVMREIESPIRSLLWDYANGEGWAHYTEQMMLDEGYGASDLRYRVAQLRQALIRLCRFVVSIRMHTQGMSIGEAARLFEKKGFMKPFPAAREAERGAFDPGYLNYTLGKMAILKLRSDWQQHVGDAYSLRDFHDRFLSYGPIPIPIIRRAMLGEFSGRAL